MAGQFGQLLRNFGEGKFSSLIGYHWSRKYNGFSVIWDGGLTRGMKASDVPWFYPSRVDSPDLLSTGLWTIGRNPKDSKKPLPKVIKATNSFLDKLPEYPIHGELWYNDDLQYVKKGARLKVPNKTFWNNVVIKGFAVKPYGTFHRIQELPESILSVTKQSGFFSALKSRRYYYDRMYDTSVMHTVKQHPMNSLTQVSDAFTEFKNSVWEGLVFTRMGSRYTNNRTSDVFKYKPIYEDSAIVVDYKEGENRHAGRCGSILVNMTLGENIKNVHGAKDSMVGKNITFSISGGLSDYQREWEEVYDRFPKGSTVDFSYLLLSANGIPQHCTLLSEGY